MVMVISMTQTSDNSIGSENRSTTEVEVISLSPQTHLKFSIIIIPTINIILIGIVVIIVIVIVIVVIVIIMMTCQGIL